MVLQLLTDPDRFFKREVESPRFLVPALIVLLIGIISAIGTVPVMQMTGSMLPGSAAQYGSVLLVFSAIFALITAFVVWAVYAVVFHAIARVAFDGQGDLKAAFSVTGWGLTPKIAAVCISAAVNFYVFQNVQLPKDSTRAASSMMALQSDPIFVVSGLLGIAFLLWQAYLWTFGLRHAYDLTLRDAALTVAFPVLVALLLAVYGLVGRF